MKSRREFVKTAAVAGAGIAANLGLAGKAWAQSANSTTARIYLDTRRTIGTVDRNIFGSFLEHLGRAIYEGVYEPGSKLSDVFRPTRVQIRELTITSIEPRASVPSELFVIPANYRKPDPLRDDTQKAPLQILSFQPSGNGGK